MAAKANVRKRKHSEHADEGAEVVPKKQQKKCKTPKKQKERPKPFENKNQRNQGENSNPENSDKATNDVPNDEDMEESENTKTQEPLPKEQPIKFSKDFKMMEFRNKLRGSAFITELRHFLYLLERKPRFAAKYIEKRGNPLELAESLERIDKSNVLHIGYVCQALHTVLMEIVSNQQSHLESAVSATRYFLKTHSAVVEQLLESPQTKHRRIALKLLTSIVCVDPQMGRQVLAIFNILSDVRRITQLLSHTTHEFHDEETVRKCYIHFVLSFLVDGNTLLVQNILDRSSLIQALIFGLLYDDQLTVCLVLKTLKKYVLESANISKTKKIHVFNLECCKCFARLYDWYGPKVYFAKFAGKNLGGQAGGHVPQEKIQSLVDAAEKETVAAAAHEFLLTLLCSRKHGIAFDAITNFRQRHNAVQGKVIGFVPKPWNNMLKTELIVRTLEACPDLARQTVRHFANVIRPSSIGTKEWPQAVNFLAKIIDVLQPKLLRPALIKLTLTDLAYWIKDICLPLDTLLCIRSANLLLNEDFECRLATHRLLLSMFLQYSNYLDAAMQREEAKGSVGSTLRRFKFDLYNHIVLHFPAVDLILRSLHATTSLGGAISTASMLEHFHVTLDLILEICKRNRAFIDKQGTILDYLKLIRPLYTGEVDDDVDRESNRHTLAKHGDILLEIKAIKTILLLAPNAIKPGQQLFENVLASFIKGFVYGSQEVQREAGDLLREIFKNTGIFQAGLLEIDLWLEALRLSPPETVDVVTQVLQKVLQVTDAEVDMPAAIEPSTNESSLNQLFENIEKGHYVQAYVETFAISKLLPLIYKGVELVKPLSKYLELVCFLLFHYHPTPAYVVRLYEMKFENQKSYMNGWLVGHKTNLEEFQAPKLPKIAALVPQLNQLQLAIFNATNESSFESIFGVHDAQAQNAFEITINGKELRLLPNLQNERLLMIYIQQFIFVVAELTEQQKLQSTQAEFAAECLAHFLAILRQQMERNDKRLVSYADDGSVSKPTSFLNLILHYVFDVRLAVICSVGLSNPVNSNYLHFLSLLADSCDMLPDFGSIVHNYRLKIINAVAIGLEAKEKSAIEFVQLVQAFQLSAENCLELLKLLCDNLKHNDLYAADVDTGGYQRTFYFDLLVCVLNRLSTLGEAVNCAAVVKPLSKFYIKMQEKLNGELNLEDFEFALIDFFNVMHQFLPLIAKKVFLSIFESTRISKASIKLASLLLERHAEELMAVFLELLPVHLTKRELIYPLLEMAFKRNFKIETSLLTTIYQEYRNGFMKSIEKPQKAGVIYKEHAACSVALVSACMPETECLDFCKKRFQFNDPSELYQLQLMQAIYEKAFKSSLKLPIEEESSNVNNAQAKMFVNFLHLHVQLLGNDLKKHAVSLEKLELVAYNIQCWCEQLPLLKSKPNFESLVKSQNWSNFCKACLKLCMQMNEGEPDDSTESVYGLLLQLLAYLCDQLYEDVINNESDSSTDSEAASLFQMICTHSKFYEIMLATKPTRVKTEVLHLLFILAKKSPHQALPQLELPLLLGAYQAKLSSADRYALALLQLYERYHAVTVQAYRPFIWGESAVACYALREADSNERAALTQQETTISLVMSLIERHQCEYTLENFPIWRKLNVGTQMPVVQFIKPNLRPFKCFGTNPLEQHVEFCFLNCSNAKTIAKPDLRLSPAADDIYAQCYDPAFFIPLMSNCFAPGAFVHTARPVQNGLLALCFAALSSHDKEMRQAAGLVQLRYREHFEQSKFFEKPLWIQAYENIQAGLADLSEAWRAKHKTHSKQYVPVPRVPYIPALFIAKTFNITNDPTNLLYKHLTFYLRLKSAFNFQTVPEFNVFFHSPEVEHHTFRHFILEVIRQGLKSSADVFLLVSTSIFKVLLGFYGGPMSNLETNLLLLSLLGDCTKIPASAKLMIEHVGILPWLKTVIVSLEFFHFDVIERVIDIITQLWYAMSATAADFYNYNFLCFEIFALLLNLLPLLSARINVLKFSRLLNVLQKTANIAKTSTPFDIVSSEQLDKLIACAQKHFGALVKPLQNLKMLGPIGAASHEEYCENLHAADVKPDAIVALSSLRAFIIDWSKCQKTEELNASTLSIVQFN